MDLNIFFPFKKLVAGDSWSWVVDLSNYSSTTWSLRYAAKSSGIAVKTFSSTAIGNSHQITVLPTVTTTYTPGSYLISVSLLSLDGEKITLGSREFTIYPDLATVSDTYDYRTYNKKCFDALSDVLFKNTSRDTLEVIFKDATFKYKSYGELLKLFNYFEQRVNEENGIKTGRIIYNRKF